MNSKRRMLRWLPVLLATLTSVLTLASAVADAAGLGKLTVQSGLGQPFRGEIELISVPAEELGAVSARTASAETYREANIEYAGSVANIKFAVEKRSNGQPYIRVFSVQPMEEPFLELLVEVAWPSGRLLREYPVLLDPPGFAGARNLPSTSVAPLPALTQSAPASAATSEAVAKAEPRKTAPAAAEGKPAAPSDAPASAPAGSSDVYGPVKPQETLRSIATRVRPQGVELEQMMVAIYRENVGAFIGKNMNQLKLGERLKLPSAEQAAKVAMPEARKLIQVQTARWIAYRQKLAARVAKSQPKAGKTQQSSAGQVTPKAPDKTPAPPSGEQLSISKGETPGDKAAAASKATKGGKLAGKALQDRISSLEEEAIAREAALKEANSRVAQLERQVEDMRKVLKMQRGEAPGDKVAAGTSQSAPSTPAQAADPKPAEPAASAPMPPKPGDMAPPPPVIVPPKPVVQPASAPAPEPGMVQQILDTVTGAISGLFSSPLLLAGIGAALLGALGLVFVRRRRAQQLGAFTATGVAAVGASASASAAAATAEAAVTAAGADKKAGLVETGESAFLSEFNKVAPGAADSDDVDPVAEADVYLAYGRDAQAEEILKEAMPKDPQRVEIPLKLLEIYAGRRSVQAFESVANSLRNSLGDDHPAWSRVCELGRGIDPGNSLYASGRAEPSLGTDSTLGRANVISFPERKAGGDTQPGAGSQEPALKDELDFDLGLNAPSAATDAKGPMTQAPSVDFDFSELGAAAPQKTDLAVSAKQDESFDLEFDIGSNQSAESDKFELPAATASANDSLAADFNIDFDLEAPATPAAPGHGEATARLAELEKVASGGFDLKSISLDLDKPMDGDVAVAAAPPATETAIGDSPMWRTAATKLDLARAYMELGDKEGAQEIIDEVMREGTPQQQQEARNLAARL